ncbi:DUF1178 family protein [Yoonia vestfoldensis]|jgi:hypothetical protein|uniref:DUF1178 family protein n=1 Tax=Yoonia vestfoldensis TaxID=245188 RepID=A0A1Y0E8V3_9RHOB|nr:DUF1178 family protein [Yoonia vestfoldensis]ARU00047.1 hypothetical protein LOKVESSMR4R_00711 [Yoonia vestfoldensis]
MIRFHLRCDQNHQFESWFQSGDAFDKLVAAKMVTCTACGSRVVTKSVMAPAIATTPAPVENQVAALRKKIESSADYVGTAFAKEARAMHDGLTPDRPIYGEANLTEARKLAEDGIPVMPLPFIPAKKAH